MLRGDYRIEPLGPSRVRLYLSSEHRLSTHFNWYARIWSDAVMSDIQREILAVHPGTQRGGRRSLTRRLVDFARARLRIKQTDLIEDRFGGCMPEDERPPVENEALLTSRFGSWPSFHDAEIVRARLDRHGPDAPWLELEIHVATTGEVDAKGRFIVKHQALVT